MIPTFLQGYKDGGLSEASELIPEFIGRLPIIFTLDGLSEDMLVKILKEPKNAILKQYQKLLALDEVKLEFEEGAFMP